MKRAVILGAGFSFAVSPLHMPLTIPLGDLVLDRLEADGVDVGRRPGREGFEAWLSRLAEAQPDLTQAQNLDNQARFARIASALRETVVAQQQKVITTEPPWWLRRFVSALHYSGNATVITFNYDMLVEYALEWCGLFDPSSIRATIASALRFGPTAPYKPSSGLTLGERRAETFQLLKLHGSVDSFWVPGDTSGATINRWDPLTRWGNSIVPSEDERREVLPGREPFLVPPAAAKSAFYTNPVSRELWGRAAKAIEEADEVALIGYSLPMTDLVTSGMLGDRLRTTNSKIVVVNPDARHVSEALEALGVQKSRVSEFTGPDTGCSDYVTSIEERLEPGWDWPGMDAHATVSVGRVAQPEHQVTGIADAAGGIATLNVSDSSWTNGASVLGPTVGEVQTAAGTPSPRVILRWPSGNESWAARSAPKTGLSGAVEGLVLAPTAQPTLS